MLPLWTALAGGAGAAEPVEAVADPGVPERPVRWTRYGAAALEGAAFNLSLNLTIRYLAREEWAAISLDSIRQNGETGWVWDEDLFATNQLSHPYHGAMFHQLSRVHGLTWWESLPIVFLGSYEWERYLETDPPSINDQVNTTLSGVLLGEMMFRMSSRVLDASSSGGERVLREALATGIAPMRGLDRLLTGKAWRPGPPTAPVDVRHALSFGVQGVGGRDLALARLRFDLAYGDLRVRRPLDTFELSVEGQLTDDLEQPGVEIFATGALIGDAITPEHLVGLFQGYDYVQSPLFGVAGAAVGPGWWADVRLGGPWALSVRWTLMVLPTAAVDSPYAAERTRRTYVFGLGGTGSARVELGHARWGHLFAQARGYAVHSPVPPVGEETLGWTTLGVEGWVVRGFGVVLQGAAYARRGRYRDFEPHAQDFGAVQGGVVARW